MPQVFGYYDPESVGDDPEVLRALGDAIQIAGSETLSCKERLLEPEHLSVLWHRMGPGDSFVRPVKIFIPCEDFASRDYPKASRAIGEALEATLSERGLGSIGVEVHIRPGKVSVYASPRSA